MEATILNKSFESVGIIDNYKSFIWTDRYNEPGDFEVHIPIGNKIPDYIQTDYYVWTAESEHLMIIETLKIESDIEEGTYLIVSGRSLESILDRRIVWNKTLIQGPINDKGYYDFPNLQEGIKRLIEENIIDTTNDRKISNFRFKVSTDPKIIGLTFGDQIEVTEDDGAGGVLYYTVGAQYHGEDLLNIIKGLCQEKYIGFKITLDDDNFLVFELYAGEDHSYGTEEKPQTKNTYVIFSKDFDNLLNTSYLMSTQKWKNVTLVGGEKEKDDNGIEKSQVLIEWSDKKAYTGLDRREVFTDASSKTMDTEDENGDPDVMSLSEYKAILVQSGIDTLMQNERQEVFDGEADTKTMFVYGNDFYMGDIVQFQTEYGVEGRAYISEYIMSTESTGKNYYPTLKILKEGEYEL